MRLLIVIGVLGLLFWLAWDKLESRFFGRFGGKSEPLELQESAPAEPAPRVSLPAGTVDQAAAPAPVLAVEPVHPVLTPRGVLDPAAAPKEPESVIVERKMKYPVPDSLLEFLRSISRSSSAGNSGDSGVFHDPATGRLFANVPDSRKAQVIAFLEAVDVPGRQVTVEACIVIASLGAGQDFGIEWLAGWSPGRADLGTGSVAVGSGSLTISAGQFGVALQNAVESRSVSVLSRPAVGCRLGGIAEISSGRQVGVVSTSSLDSNVLSSVEFKDVSLSLAVEVIASGEAFRVEVDQRNDELGGTVVVEGKPIPEISTQQLKTSLLLDPGRWASAGSVVIERDSSSRAGFRFFPSSNKSTSTARQEIGVFLRVMDGLALRAEPVPSAAPVLRAEPVPSVRVSPVRPKLFGPGVKRIKAVRLGHKPPRERQ